MSARPRIVDVAELDFAFEPQPWDFARDRAAEIAAHWRQAQAAKPQLFDGRVLLLRRHDFVAGDDGRTILRGGYSEVAFSAFLAWRDFNFPDASICNGFSMAALQGSDGAFVLGEMADHTANAGSIYFPAGTPDAKDVFAGKVDLFASARRELSEETGIAPEEVEFDAGWRVVYAPPRIACIKRARSALSAGQLQARIHAFLRRDPQAEFARTHIIAAPADIDPARTPAFVVAYLKRALAQVPAG